MKLPKINAIIAEAIMCPASDASEKFNGIIQKKVGVKSLVFISGKDILFGWQPQHLYLVTDDKPVGNDWVVCPDGKSVVNVMPTMDEHEQWWCIISGARCEVNGSDFRKIIAATDPKCELPKIPASMVKRYVDTDGIINMACLRSLIYAAGTGPNIGTIDMVLPELNCDGEVIPKQIFL